jgi:hypothetical protein
LGDGERDVIHRDDLVAALVEGFADVDQLKHALCGGCGVGQAVCERLRVSSRTGRGRSCKNRLTWLWRVGIGFDSFPK